MSFLEKTKQYFKDKLDTLSQLERSWTNRSYEFYLIFGQNEESKFPWKEENWKKDLEPYFDLLLKQTKSCSQTGIRVNKFQPQKRVTKKEKEEFIYLEEIKLGRLRWDPKSSEKWTIASHEEGYFQHFELWTPIWSVCNKREMPPDVFISITNENDFENNGQVAFGYLIVIAVAKDLKIETHNIIRELSEKINSKITVLKSRRWGKTEQAGNWTFVNGIQDTFSNGIYKGANLHLVPFNELEFEPFWKVIHRPT